MSNKEAIEKAINDKIYIFQEKKKLEESKAKKGDIVEHCSIIDIDQEAFDAKRPDGYYTDTNGRKYKYSRISFDPKKNRAIIWHYMEVVNENTWYDIGEAIGKKLKAIENE